MDFLELVGKRHSVRSYSDQSVEQEKLMQILEAARLAPSACNVQPWYIVVLQGEQVKGLASAYARSWFLEAPLVLCVCADTTAAWARGDRVSYAMVDAAILMEHIVLAATELGLGSCWVGAFDVQALRGILQVPQHIMPVAMTPLGYSASEPQERPRKSLDEIVRWGGFEPAKDSQ
jgi:nitroreductase